MHELSICLSLLSQVAAIAKDRGAESVDRIVIDVGPLSGVEPLLLADAFEIARAGSCAAQAQLSITTTKVIVGCLECGTRSPAAPNRLQCASCGGYRTKIVTGDEMILRRVDLRVRESPPASAAA